MASILSRRFRLPGLMWDLDNTPLLGGLPFAGPDRGSRMKCVRHDPRRAGPVCPSPQTTAAGLRGMGVTTPVERGMWATTPKRGRASRHVPPPLRVTP